MQITIYSTTTCPYCKMLKDYLSEKHVQYVDKLVDQDGDAREEMMNASGGFLGVPFTVIINDNNTQETVVGFDKNRINNLLGL